MALAAESFIWGPGGAQMTPESIAIQRKVAAAMMAKASDYSPVEHWTQGLARMSQGLVGGMKDRQATAAEQGNSKYNQDLITGLLTGGAGTAAPVAAVSPAVANVAAAMTAPVMASDGMPAPRPPVDIPMVERIASVSTVGETGKAGFGNQAQIAIDTGGSKSYGVFGLNTWGKDPNATSAGRFANTYGKSLGFTAPVGTRDFDNQWKAVATNNPDALKNAQLEWYNNEVLGKVTTGLTKAGVPEAFSSDPRVQAYFADRMVQQGPHSTTSHAQRIAGALNGAISPEAFLQRMSAADKAALPRDFRTYLSEHPSRTVGLANRVDKRLALSSGIMTAGVSGSPGVRAINAAIAPGGAERVYAANEYNPVDATADVQVVSPDQYNPIDAQADAMRVYGAQEYNPIDAQADAPEMFAPPGAPPPPLQPPSGGMSFNEADISALTGKPPYTPQNVTPYSGPGASFDPRDMENFQDPNAMLPRTRVASLGGMPQGSPYEAQTLEQRTIPGQPSPYAAQTLPQPAPAAAPTQLAQAGGAPMGVPAAPALNPNVIRALSDPRASPEAKAIAKLMYQQHLEQNKETTIDLGNAIGVMRGGQIVRTIPKVRDPMDAEGKRLEIEAKRKALAAGEKPISVPEGNRLWDPATRSFIGDTGASSNPYATGKMNEGQGKAATFADRMNSAHTTLTDLENINEGAGGVLMGGLAKGLLGDSTIVNAISSPERQKVQQAQRNFINAVLRRESGAVIGASEFANARLQYFPQPMDSPEVIQQKRQNRIEAITGIMREAGPNYVAPGVQTEPQAAPKKRLRFNAATGQFE